MRVKVHTQLSVSPAEVEHKHKSPVVENNEDHQLAIMGVSTGGPGTVETILRHLPADFSLPIIVNQHMPESFTAAFAQSLIAICNNP